MVRERNEILKTASNQEKRSSIKCREGSVHGCDERKIGERCFAGHGENKAWTNSTMIAKNI